MGFLPPNYTQTPNDLFDRLLPLLKESELKVLLAIMRKTFGWHKIRDAISITQLMKMTGLARETVIDASKSLQLNGLIKREVVGLPGKQNTIYELAVSEDSNKSYQSENPTPPVGFTQLGKPDPQKKESSSKETTAKEIEPAAVSLIEIFEEIKAIDIPQYQKEQICNHNDRATVKNALEWSTDPSNPPRKGLAASIKFACKHKLGKADLKGYSAEKSKGYALKYNSIRNGCAHVDACKDYVEIIVEGGIDNGPCIDYNDKDFMNKFTKALRKYGFLKEGDDDHLGNPA